MEKTTTNLCVHPIVKQAVGEALKQLGVPMATAVDMQPQQLLRQTSREDLTIPL